MSLLLLEILNEKTMVKAKYEGVLAMPEGAWNTWNASKIVSHVIDQAKKRGKGAISKAIVNLVRWNKKQNPKLSRKAQGVLNTLSKSEAWNSIESKKASYVGLKKVKK